jgi:hypothetical protein
MWSIIVCGPCMVWVWSCVYRAFGMFHFEMLISTYGIQISLSQHVASYVYIHIYHQILQGQVHCNYALENQNSHF